MRSPLGRVAGLGSAKEGVEHWWRQRLTAIALTPLSVWFAASVIAHLGSGHEEFKAWLRAPVPAIIMMLLIGATFYHAVLGVQVVIEDYIHGEGTKLTALVTLRLACFLLAAAGIFAVLRIALGA